MPNQMKACGKAESMKGNSEDRSSQSSAELETVEAAGGVKQSSGVNRKSTNSGLNQTSSASQRRSGARFPAESQATRNDPGAPDDQSGTNVSAAESEEAENHTEDETIYIRIPVTVMFGSEPGDVVKPVQSPNKLINGFPSNTDIRKRKSYVMSFDNETNNAKWVYEILNSDSLVDNCRKLKPFENDYHKGHLAAAANHRWCREANHDTNLFSNIIPQHKKLNQGMWKKLENRCRKIQQKKMECNVHVYTGPLYLREKNDACFRVRKFREMNRMGGKVIPTHLFKVIIVENKNGTVEEPECYVMPNEEPEHENLTDYNWDIKNIEAASGLTFIQHRPNANMRDHMKTVTLQGEGGNGESHTVNIYVRISS
ncbi:endonuclease G, mitochondrial-like [Onychostoma macrolepis]|uniref:endonuclease G, mitochondrial-like n=1 Tax=Onychostoma macrolepis TaxID=369639 RepID=UPI00272B13AE|nr:endonuclease G, mitochondrial-like [Onychostoma macrolepis]